MHHPHRTLTSVAALLLLGLGIGSAATAAVLNDPTRPLLPGLSSASGGDTGARLNTPGSAAVAEAAASAAPAAEPTVQSLQIPRDGEPSALVDGQLLRIGDHVGAYAVTAIDAQGLSVRGPTGRERWTLTGVQYLDRIPATRMSETPRRPAPAAVPSWIPVQAPVSVQAPAPAPVQAPASWPAVRPSAPEGVTSLAPMPPGAPLKLALDMQPGPVTPEQPPSAGAVVPVRLSWAEQISPVPVQQTDSVPWSSPAVVQVGRWRQLEQLPHLATPAASTAMQPGQMLAAQRLQAADGALRLSGAISHVGWTLPNHAPGAAPQLSLDAPERAPMAAESAAFQLPSGVATQAAACLLAAVFGLAAALVVGSVVGPIPDQKAPRAALRTATATRPAPTRQPTPPGPRLRTVLLASPLPPPDHGAARRSLGTAVAKEIS